MQALPPGFMLDCAATCTLEGDMQKISFRKVLPGQVEGLRKWMETLMARQEEVIETFVEETVTSEQAWLLETSEGHVLVYCVEADDLEAAANAYRTSELTIDLEHRAAMKELVGENASAELLYKVTRERNP